MHDKKMFIENFNQSGLNARNDFDINTLKMCEETDMETISQVLLKTLIGLRKPQVLFA